MKIPFVRIAMWMLFLVACPSSVWAQQATVNRNVILRRDPSTKSLALAHLPKGARLTLVQMSPDSGFYHVRTEDDQVGWVCSKARQCFPGFDLVNTDDSEHCPTDSGAV